MEKQKEECKNQQQSKGYSDMTIEELEKIIKEFFTEVKYKSEKNTIFDPFYGRPQARKMFDTALKREYPNWFDDLEKENNANN